MGTYGLGLLAERCCEMLLFEIDSLAKLFRDDLIRLLLLSARLLLSLPSPRLEADLNFSDSSSFIRGSSLWMTLSTGALLARTPPVTRLWNVFDGVLSPVPHPGYLLLVKYYRISYIRVVK